MKKLVLVLMLIMCIPLFAQDNNFEGKATFKVSTEKDAAEFDYYIKAGSYRMDLRNENESVSILQTDENMTVLMHEQNMYMEFPKAMMDMMKKQKHDSYGEEAEDMGAPEKTGNTKELLGYNAEEWKFEDEQGNKVLMWVTDEVGNFMFIDSPMQKMKRPAWQEAISENGYFPLMITVFESDGAEKAIWEVTEITEMDVDAAMFNAPEGYEKMDMQKMMQKGMKGKNK